MNIGDWLVMAKEWVSAEMHEAPGRRSWNETDTAIYEYAGMDYSQNQPRILAYPVLLREHPAVDRSKRPHYLMTGEWRKATDEEIAGAMAKRIRGQTNWLDNISNNFNLSRRVGESDEELKRRVNSVARITPQPTQGKIILK